MKRAIAALLVFVLPASLVHADNRQVVLWHITDFPPTYIIAGPNQGKGMGDRRIQILGKRMSQFRHEVVVTTPKQLVEALRAEPHACNAGMLKTPERESLLEFSAVPYADALPNGIITTRKRLALFQPFINEFGDLRLGDFLSSGKWRLGIVAGRSFGAGIDAALKKHADKMSVVLSEDHLATRLTILATQNQFEAVIGLPTELSYLTRELGLNERDFVFLPVAEQQSLVPSYIACSKSAFGIHAIATINRLLADSEVQSQIMAAYIAWLDEETAAHYRRLRRQSRAR
jgi:uncharacterized protein (TIGR02285 family)